MFSKILIANRGEIACRIINTCREMDVRTVAVFSDADRDALHVQEADEAVYIGPSPATESYLDGKKIIKAAKQTGAEAIHPGYGFLSENSGFAKACAKESIVFIGPPAKAIEIMGDKAKAKKLMEKAGVPLVPGAYGVSKAALKKTAAKIGYPVLIKAVAGGGGKGMRVVEREKDFDAALDAAQREGKSSFGNDEVMVEKYLKAPRHIEVQVFSDGQGNTVHMFERDCSLQRRHQKVVEEAPAPHLSDDLRRKMGKAAVSAAEAVGYVGAGTVEFLLEGKNFYFMEMNTRLQVEHPVTEAITDMDLVFMQIQTAAGGVQLYEQEDIFAQGHAIEVRLYAENPGQNFMPATGDLIYCRLPQESNNVRVDSGVVPGDSVTHYYDPMLAKIITLADTRKLALQYMREALASTLIVGVETNLAYLERILRLQAFINGKVTTRLLEESHTALTQETKPPQRALLLGALFLAEKQQEQRRYNPRDPFSPWLDAHGWRLGGTQPQVIEFVQGAVSLTEKKGGWQTQAGEVLYPSIYADTLEVMFAEGKVTATIIEDGDKLHIAADNLRAVLELVKPLDVRVEEVLSKLTAPLPGKVVKVLAKKGEKVKKGDDLVLIEAMKTEHHITAPADGTVDGVHFKEGQSVDKDDVLVDFTPKEAT